MSGFHTNFQRYTAEYGLGWFSRVLTHYLRWFHNRTRLTLVPSTSQRLELERRGFERLALLSRGVDSQLFSPARRTTALRESWGLEIDDIALLHVGRLAAEKNLGLLERSLKALRDAYPQRRMKLIVVGDGPHRTMLEQQLPDAVFCGEQRGEALAEHYASGDVFLFPSLTETFGNVVLEAMAAGLPVVTTSKGVCGLDVEKGRHYLGSDDAADLALFITQLLAQPQRLKQLSDAARDFVCQEHDWSVAANQLESVYARMLSARNAPAANPLSAYDSAE
ncbi:D-inositol-3-phosphate glycosyltransferase [compost metagenome]